MTIIDTNISNIEIYRLCIKSKERIMKTSMFRLIRGSAVNCLVTLRWVLVYKTALCAHYLTGTLWSASSMAIRVCLAGYAISVFVSSKLNSLKAPVGIYFDQGKITDCVYHLTWEQRLLALFHFKAEQS